MKSINEIREMMGNATDAEVGLPEGTMQAAAEWIYRNANGDLSAMSDTKFNSLVERAIEAVK